MEKYSYLITERNISLLTTIFLAFVSVLYCRVLTGGGFLSLVSTLKNGRNSFTVNNDDSPLPKPLRPVDDVILNGGVGSGTVSGLLAEQTKMLIDTGVEVIDDFISDLQVGESGIDAYVPHSIPQRKDMQYEDITLPKNVGIANLVGDIMKEDNVVPKAIDEASSSTQSSKSSHYTHMVGDIYEAPSKSESH